MAALFRQSPRPQLSGGSSLPLTIRPPPVSPPLAPLPQPPPEHTDPLFPPLPFYGPATPARYLQSLVFRATSGVISLCFLAVIVLGALAESIPPLAADRWARLRGRDPDVARPFAAIESDCRYRAGVAGP